MKIAWMIGDVSRLSLKFIESYFGLFFNPDVVWILIMLFAKLCFSYFIISEKKIEIQIIWSRNSLEFRLYFIERKKKQN